MIDILIVEEDMNAKGKGKNGAEEFSSQGITKYVDANSSTFKMEK